MKREKVYLVDKNDNVIGSKWRDELTDEDCWRVVSIWVTDRSGNILLQQRSFQKDLDPGDWSAAAEGTVIFGDEYDESAKRELEEEIGIANGILVPVGKIHHRMLSKGWRVRQGYLCIIDHIEASNIKIQKSEVEQVRWFSPEEFKKFTKDPEIMSLLNIYKEIGFIN